MFCEVKNSTALLPKSMGAGVHARYSHSSLAGTFVVSRKLVAGPVTTTAVRAGRVGTRILLIPSQKMPEGDCLMSAAITKPALVGINIARVPPDGSNVFPIVEPPNAKTKQNVVHEATKRTCRERAATILLPNSHTNGPGSEGMRPGGIGRELLYYLRKCRMSILEQTAIRRVPSVYHGLSGTKRDRLISKGFLH